jgi:hypothetical protein
MARGRPRKDREDVLMKSAEFIGWALGGLEREIAQTRERLSSLTAQAAKLRAQVGQRTTSSRAAIPAETATAGSIAESGGGRRRRRRNMSAEARKRISDRMKKRWAEYRKAKGNA